ncbi:MAG: glycosyltransferase [Christensenellales bacterium]
MKQVVRVLNIISGLNHAGTEAVAMNYYRHIDRTRVQFDFLVLNEGEGYYEKEIEELGGKIYKICNFTSNPIKCIKQRNAFFKAHRYDVVEIHSPSVLRYAYAKLAKKYGAKKIIYHIHSSVDKDNLLVKFSRRQVVKYCTQLVACSRLAGKTAYGEGVDFEVVTNAVDYKAYAFDKQARDRVRQRLDIAEEDFIIGQVGRYSEVKNHRFSLRLLKELSKKHTDVKMLFKGFGELEQSLRSQAEDLGIADKVIWCKDEDAPTQDCYSAMDMLIMPSLYEGLPMVLVEAQINGLECLVSDNVTKESKIFDQATFIPLDDVERWIDEIEKLIASPIRISVDDETAQASGYSIYQEAKKREEFYLDE